MKSIVYEGVFTSHGLIAAILVAFGISLIFKGVNRNNSYARADKKIYIGGILSILLGIASLIIYIGQIHHLVA